VQHLQDWVQERVREVRGKFHMVLGEDCVVSRPWLRRFRRPQQRHSTNGDYMPEFMYLRAVKIANFEFVKSTSCGYWGSGVCGQIRKSSFSDSSDLDAGGQQFYLSGKCVYQAVAATAQSWFNMAICSFFAMGLLKGRLLRHHARSRGGFHGANSGAIRRR
jgi:hypothetical protein